MTKTKIIATIGPACDDKKSIEKLIQAGASIFQLDSSGFPSNSVILRVKRSILAREQSER